MSHVAIAHADQPRFVLHQSVDARIQDCAYAARRRVPWELSCILFLARSADLEMIKFEFENQQRLEAEKLQARSLSDPHIVVGIGRESRCVAADLGAGGEPLASSPHDPRPLRTGFHVSLWTR